MKIALNQALLTKHLAIAGYAVPNKAATLPILDNVLLETVTLPDEDALGLKISGCNLETFLQTTIRPAQGLTVIEEGSLCVPHKLLANFVDNLAAGEMVYLITEEEGANELLVKSGRSQAKLKGNPSEGFPLMGGAIGEGVGNNGVVMEAATLKKSIEQVEMAAADPSRKQVKLVMTGINLSFKQPQVTFAACDSFRLAVCQASLLKSCGQDFSATVVAKALTALARLLPEDKSLEITIGLNHKANSLIFECKPLGLYLSASLLEGQYPNYEAIIPKADSFVSRLVAPVKELNRAARVNGFFIRENSSSGAGNFGMGNVFNDGGSFLLSVQPGQNSAEPGQLVLEARGEYGTNRTELDVQLEGQSNQARLRNQFWLDGLNALETEQATILLIDQTQPVVLQPAGQAAPDFTYVLMPMALESKATSTSSPKSRDHSESDSRRNIAA